MGMLNCEKMRNLIYEKMGNFICWLQRCYEEGKIIGREEGINIGVEKERERSEKEKEDAIRKAISKQKLSLEEIAEVFGVSVEFVKHFPKGVD